VKGLFVRGKPPEPRVAPGCDSDGGEPWPSILVRIKGSALIREDGWKLLRSGEAMVIKTQIVAFQSDSRKGTYHDGDRMEDRGQGDSGGSHRLDANWERQLGTKDRLAEKAFCDAWTFCKRRSVTLLFGFLLGKRVQHFSG
jgi:hypothetical protein